MRVRSLIALVAATTMIVGPLQITSVQAATGFMQLISAQQFKAQGDMDEPPPPPPPPPKKAKKAS